MNIQAKNTKNQSSPFVILELPHKGVLVQVPSPAKEHHLFFHNDKKICIESYSLLIQKTKLFKNLEIYEWRRQTQFPISKVQYVNIKQNYLFESQNVQLLVYIQHCPWRLNNIKKLSFSQTLFILKECIFGFERLFKKFGAFYVTQNMIAMNQKGQCRVWMEQSYANNFCLKSLSSEQMMVKSIQQIIEKRCQSSKLSQNFFSKLRGINTFLSVLKQIDRFSASQKINIPFRYFPQGCSEISRSKQLTKYQCTSTKNFRHSIVASRKNNKSLCPKQSISIEKSKGQISIQIKKIKSQQNIKTASLMKKSDGQTNYTRNIKECRRSNVFNFCFTPNQESLSRQFHNNSVLSGQKKQIGQCSFTIELENLNDKKSQKKDRKDLYYSSSGMNPENSLSKEANRSFNLKKVEQRNLKELHNLKIITNRRNPSYSYMDQFSSILDFDKKQTQSARRKPVRDEDQEQSNFNQLRSSHTESVMKNNGWKSFTGFLEEPKELNQSFHEGQEQNMFLKQIKLQKLESLGRRGPAMSILPEQIQDII